MMKTIDTQRIEAEKKAKRKVYDREYYLKNREKLIAYRKKYYRLNRESINFRRRQKYRLKCIEAQRLEANQDNNSQNVQGNSEKLGAKNGTNV